MVRGVTVASPGACDERFVRFGDSGTLVGVLSEPRDGARRAPVVVLGAGLLHRSGPSRASVALARSLAAVGHPVLRFDLSGIGDSPLDGRRTLRETVLADIRSAVDCVTGAGATTDVVLVGFCSGADNAFAYAADDPRIGSLVLFDPIVHRTVGHVARRWGRRLLRSRTYTALLDGRVLAMLRSRLRRATSGPSAPPEYFSMLVAGPAEADRLAVRQAQRGVRRLFLLTSGVHDYCSAPQQVREALPQGFAPESDTVVWAPEVDHVLSRPAQVDWLLRVVGDWIRDRAGVGSPSVF